MPIPIREIVRLNRTQTTCGGLDNPPHFAFCYKVSKLIVLLLPASLLLALWVAFFATPGKAAEQVCTPYPSPHLRFGFNLDLANGDAITNYATEQLNAHWFLDYTFRQTPTVPAGMAYAHTIRAAVWKRGNYTQSVVAAAKANPGGIWILGNEPDRHGQDGLTAQEFATFYHELYSLLKQADNTARVAVGAVVQGTPLRLYYLNLVLEAYRAKYGKELATDVWTVHGFILLECNRPGCWGASLPPGLEALADLGRNYTIADHGSLELFKQQIIDFRSWMATHGYRETPLLLTEYGILFPPQLGFTHDKVSAFMKGSFDFLLHTTDTQIGYPADGNRLVQAWSWFSLNVPAYDIETRQGFNGNLFDSVTKEITPLGLDFADYSSGVRKDDVDLGLSTLTVQPSTLLISEPLTVTVTLDLRNSGGVNTNDVVLDISLKPFAGSEKGVVQQVPLNSLDAGCGQVFSMQVNLHSFITTSQLYLLSFDVRSSKQNLESDLSNNHLDHWLLVLDEPLSDFSYLPLVER